MSAALAGVGPRESRRCLGSYLPALIALVLLSGCATGHPRATLLSGHGRRSLAPSFSSAPKVVRPVSSFALEDVAGSAGGFPERRQADAFQVVQEASGLEEEAWHPPGAALYLEQARRLLGQLAKTRVTQRSFAPRLALSWLLREALAGGERVEYAELLHRTERFWQLVVVRPDGYLVEALTGQPLQRMGPVKLERGELMAGGLVLGAFYFSRAGVIYPVDESLRRANTVPWAELGLERDWLNAALDGAQDAMGEMALALAQSVLHPIRSAEDLVQLPTTVAQLIASSPEYFKRYGAMSLQDQIREAARLSTHVLMMFGSSGGTVGTVSRVGALGAELPVLAVSAEGLLVVRTVVVSAGTVTTTLEVGAGSVAILHMAASSGSWPPVGGPGKWIPDTSSMSDDARAYQAQVTKAPKGWAYEVCRDGECVKYDGYDLKDDCLQEAKGKGYDKWFKPDLDARFEFQGLDDIRTQAEKQAWVAGGMRVRWYVAEPRMVAILEKLFKKWNVTGIEVVYERPQP